MRIKVIQHTDNRFTELLKITKPKNIEYCKKYNLDYEAYEGDFVPKNITSERRVYWNKPFILKNIIENEKYDWIFYLDADAVILDHSIDLKYFIKASDKNSEFIVCYVNQRPQDKYWNFNFGVFFLKSSEYALDILNSSIEACEINNGSVDDQPIFQAMLRENYKKLAEKTSIFPSKAFNDHGDFIYHALGITSNNTGNEKSKLDQLKEVLKHE